MVAADNRLYGQTALNLAGRRHRRAAADSDVGAVDRASPLAVLETPQHLPGAFSHFADIEYYAVTNRIDKTLFLDSLHRQGSGVVNLSEGGSDLRAADFESHYIFMFHQL